METITTTAIRTINNDIKEAIQSVAAKHGVSIKLGNTRYTTDNYSTKLEVAVIKNGKVVTQKSSDFDLYKESFGVNANLGDKFYDRGEEYEITGLAPRSTKYPILCKNLHNGKTYKFPVDEVNNHFPNN